MLVPCWFGLPIAAVFGHPTTDESINQHGAIAAIAWGSPVSDWSSDEVISSQIKCFISQLNMVRYNNLQCINFTTLLCIEL